MRYRWVNRAESGFSLCVSIRLTVRRRRRRGIRPFEFLFAVIVATAAVCFAKCSTHCLHFTLFTLLVEPSCRTNPVCDVDNERDCGRTSLQR